MLVSDRLRRVFIAALELEEDVEVLELRHGGHPRWDSLGHLALLVAIEDEFEVEIDSEQLISIDSFPMALKILADLGIADHAGSSKSSGVESPPL
ncbi:acyl carrier protein [Micromonospora sp. C95]|uniref:acyl carrier protein n=1 Tax=Micromonospora sp. C95 TaxID=2824882 RepID=UPI001B389470|nr:acyl carrier protein [Micromonospora sp. C95]MBQ1026046.1 acyl carrier protein [Micromonospora sp. C95]